MPSLQHQLRQSISCDRGTVGVAALTAAFYLIAGQYVTWLNDPSNLGAGFWPGAGISLAALLLTSRRSWPLILLAVGLAELANDLASGYTLAASLWWTAANVLEPALAAVLLTRLGVFRLDGVRSVVRFILVAGILAPTAAALLGATGSMHQGATGPYLLVVAGWIVGDGLGVLTVTPAILMLRCGRARRALLGWSGISSMAVLVLVSVLVFHDWNESWDVTLPYLILPPMVWLALRHRLAGAAAATLVVAQIAIATTGSGHGPFAHAGAGGAQSIWLLQLFLLTAAATALLLGAQATESRQHRREAADQSRRADHETLLRTLGHAGLVASDAEQLCSQVLDTLAPALAPARVRLESAPPTLRRVAPTGPAALAPPSQVHYRLHLDEHTGAAPAEAGQLVASTQRLLDDQAVARLSAQYALEASNQQLRQALASKDRFVNIVSHELRTPLTPIIGFSELLLKRLNDVDDVSRVGLEVIHRQGQHLLELVERILSIADLTQQGATPTPVSVSVTATANAVIAQLGTPPVEITVHGCDRALVDPLHLHQILTDLLSNAMRYGAPPIELTIEGQTDRLAIAVVDHGPGIDPSFTDELFDLFTQPDTDDRRRSEGLGVGLTIVKILVEANGGTAAYQPTGDGSRFVITLPAPPDGKPLPVHDVIIYDQPQALFTELTGMLRAGLEAQVPTIVIATPAVRTGFEAALRTAGIDPAGARERDLYLDFDAATLLDILLEGGRPNPDRLAEFFHSLEQRLGDARPQIYGEMVTVAMNQGLTGAALELEDLWNDLITQYDFDLYCSYPAACLSGPDGEMAAAAIRQQHRTTIDTSHTDLGLW